jgi:hypothetical protein
MTQPTIPDYFGLGSQVITSETTIAATAANPYLIIPFNGLDASGLTDATNMGDPDRVFAAILKQTRIFTAADTAEESGVEVLAPRKGFATRGAGSGQKLSFSYDVTVYLPDQTGNDPDPDQVV